jgi:hypothetical protein
LQSLGRLDGTVGAAVRTPPTREPAEAGAAEPALLSNFLIEQVERQLAGAPSENLEKIRAALGSYRELLAAGRDEAIDELEEQLYTWLDSRKSPESQRPALDT